MINTALLKKLIVLGYLSGQNNSPPIYTLLKYILKIILHRTVWQSFYKNMQGMFISFPLKVLQNGNSVDQVN